MFGGLKNYNLWWTNDGIIRHVISKDIEVLNELVLHLQMNPMNYSIYID
jgi:hypothetical protein